MNNLLRMSCLLLLGLTWISAQADKGLYVFIGGGSSELFDSKLTSTTVVRQDLAPNVTLFSISYNQKNAFSTAGRGAIGYMFYQNASKTSSFGLETGYNYFTPINSQSQNELIVPLFNLRFSALTRERTTAYSTDLLAVYHQRLGHSRLSLIAKLGGAYEKKRTTITNDVPDLPGELPSSEKFETSVVGVAGGAGLSYNLTKHVAIQTEVDAMDGQKGFGYVQWLGGLSFIF